MPSLRPVQTERHPPQVCAAARAGACFLIPCAAQRLLEGLKSPATA